MTKKMSVMGVGGKIGVVVGPCLAAAIGADIAFAPLFKISPQGGGALLYAGIALTAVGFLLNVAASLSMLRAHKAGRLATGGFYRLLLNPMYVFMLLLTLPGIALLCNSWLVMVVVLPGYIAYRVIVREEYRYLAQTFGPAYEAYRRTVLAPFL